MKSYSSLDFFTSTKTPFDVSVKRALFEFDQLYFPYPWSDDDWNKFLSSYSYSAVVARDDQMHILGFVLCLGSREDDVAHLVKILVTPQQRQLGLGSSLLVDWCARMRDFGQHKSVYLEVEKTNHQAINFYHKHQFLVLRTLKDFYGPNRDAQAMALSLDNKQNT